MDLLMGKSNSKSINKLLDKIKKDLDTDKEIHNKFIRKAKEINYGNYTVEINISGETEKYNTNLAVDIKKELITPFFYGKTNKVLNKREEAEKVIKEAEDVSFWGNLIFGYNSKVETKRKEMFEKIKNIYSCVNIESNLNDKNYSENERNKWFYQKENTRELGEALVDIFEEEYKKLSELEKFINACREFNDSINEFFKYTQQFINMKINNTSIAYDVDLI